MKTAAVLSVRVVFQRRASLRNHVGTGFVTRCSETQVLGHLKGTDARDQRFMPHYSPVYMTFHCLGRHIRTPIAPRFHDQSHECVRRDHSHVTVVHT